MGILRDKGFWCLQSSLNLIVQKSVCVYPHVCTYTVVVSHQVLCLTLCDAMDCSTPGLPPLTISWNLLKFMSIDSVMPSYNLILCCHLLLLPQSFPASRSLSTSHLFTSGGQSIGASASVLTMRIQGVCVYINIHTIYRENKRGKCK